MSTSSNPFVAVFQRVKDYVDGKVIVAATEPADQSEGTFWFNPDTSELHISVEESSE